MVRIGRALGPYLSEVRAPPIFKVRIILLRLVTVSDETNNAKDHIIQWTASVPSVYFFFARAVSEGTPRIIGYRTYPRSVVSTYLLGSRGSWVRSSSAQGDTAVRVGRPANSYLGS